MASSLRWHGQSSWWIAHPAYWYAESISMILVTLYVAIIVIIHQLSSGLPLVNEKSSPASPKPVGDSSSHMIDQYIMIHDVLSYGNTMSFATVKYKAPFANHDKQSWLSSVLAIINDDCYPQLQAMTINKMIIEHQLLSIIINCNRHCFLRCWNQRCDTHAVAHTQWHTRSGMTKEKQRLRMEQQCAERILPLVKEGRADRDGSEVMVPLSVNQ